MSANLRQVLEGMDGIEFDVIYVGTEDYRRFPAPEIIRISSVLELTWVVSNKLEGTEYSSYDAVLLCGFEFCWSVRKVVGRVPIILCLDTTPVTARALVTREQPSLLAGVKGQILTFIYKAIYGSVFRKLSASFPLSHWCAQSLVDDFHVPPERIVPCYTSLDLSHWCPRQACTTKDEALRLLFVGNDFKRKGGEELLRLYSDVLSRECVLTIVSSDPILDGRELPSGVERLKNIPHEDMHILFKDADVFVFPSWRDQLALVLAEAMACGQAVISRDGGGIGDIVRDGWNGYLMPYDAPMADWGERILALARDREAVCAMGRHSRELALELFDRKVYGRKVRDTLRAVLAGELLPKGM